MVCGVSVFIFYGRSGQGEGKMIRQRQRKKSPEAEQNSRIAKVVI